MKKKFKLFASIASISMTLALMVFGIWAATSVNVTISSNVSYTAEGVAFTLYGKSELASAQPTGDATELTESTADQTLTVDVTNAGSGSMILPDQTFTADNTWVVYTFTIENIGSNVIENISLMASVNDDNVEASSDTPVGNLAQGAKETFRCYFNIKNLNATIQDGATSVVIAVNPQPLATPTITKTTEENPWEEIYVPAYTVSNIPASATTLEIRWGINDTSRHAIETDDDSIVTTNLRLTTMAVTGSSMEIDMANLSMANSVYLEDWGPFSGAPVSPWYVRWRIEVRVGDGISYSDWTALQEGEYTV